MKRGALNTFGHAVRRIGMALALGLMWAFSPASAEPLAPTSPSSYDCGAFALYSLLRIEGRAVHPRDLEARLPPPLPGGLSMKRLRDAASSLGLHLTGVRFSGSISLDRPALVFTRRGVHGHYLVLRPVGHTGKLVQVIDSADDPSVVDMADLASAPGWTGLALIPSRPNWPALAGWGLLCAGLMIPLTHRIWRCAPHLHPARHRR